MDFTQAVLIIYQLIFSLPSTPSGDPQQVCSILPFWQLWLGMDDCSLHAKDRCEMLKSKPEPHSSLSTSCSVLYWAAKRMVPLFSNADHSCFLCSSLQLNSSLKSTFLLTGRWNKAEREKQLLKRPPWLRSVGQAQVLLPPTPVSNFPAVAGLPCRSHQYQLRPPASSSVLDWSDRHSAPQCHQPDCQRAWQCVAHTSVWIGRKYHLLSNPQSINFKNYFLHKTKQKMFKSNGIKFWYKPRS